jgi:hypothetical protein
MKSLVVATIVLATNPGSAIHNTSMQQASGANLEVALQRCVVQSYVDIVRTDLGNTVLLEFPRVRAAPEVPCAVHLTFQRQQVDGSWLVRTEQLLIESGPVWVEIRRADLAQGQRITVSLGTPKERANIAATVSLVDSAPGAIPTTPTTAGGDATQSVTCIDGGGQPGEQPCHGYKICAGGLVQEITLQPGDTAHNGANWGCQYQWDSGTSYSQN